MPDEPSPPTFRDRWLAFSRGITGTFYLIVAALAVPLIVVPIIALKSASKANDDAQRSALTYSARALAASVDAEIDTLLALVQTLSVSPALLSDDVKAFETDARRVTAKFSNAWVLLSGLDGQQLVNTGVAAGQSLPRRTAAGLVVQARAVASGQPEVSNVVFGPARQRWVATIDLAIPLNGAPYRVLSVVTSLEGFSTLLSRQNLPAGWLVAIIDREGNYVAREPREAELVGKPAAQGFRATQTQEGLFEFNSLEGEPLTQANAISSKSGWTVGVASRKAEMAARTNKTLQWTVMLAVGVAITSFIIATFLARRIVGEIGHFRARSAALVQGRSAEFNSTVPEIAETWTALDAAVKGRKLAEAERRKANQQRERAHRALQDNEVRLRLALDAAKLGLWQYNIKDGTVSWDERFKLIFDVTETESQLDIIIQRLLPEDVPKVQAALAASLASASSPCFIQYRITRSDGAIRWIEAHGVTHFEGQNEGRHSVRVVGTVADITETKAQEEHTQMLMREVAHRSKNVLSLVQSIARLTAKAGHADFSARFSERLQSLAASQDIIVSGNWHSVDLSTLVQSQLAHFKELIGARIMLDGATMRVSPSAAQTIGMALHELATNASKYGALSSTNGHVRIVWGIVRGAEGDRFEMSWTERDGPPVVPPSRRGFGSTVIETMAKGGLSADIRLSYPPTGVEWVLSCPLERVRVNVEEG